MKYIILLTTLCFAQPIEFIDAICITEQAVKAKCKYGTNDTVLMKTQDGEYVDMGKFAAHEVKEVNGVLEIKLKELKWNNLIK